MNKLRILLLILSACFNLVGMEEKEEQKYPDEELEVQGSNQDYIKSVSGTPWSDRQRQEFLNSVKKREFSAEEVNKLIEDRLVCKSYPEQIQDKFERLKFILTNNFTRKNITLGLFVLLIMYKYRAQFSRLMSAIKQVLTLTRYEKAAVVFSVFSGLVVVFSGSKGSQDDSSSDSKDQRLGLVGDERLNQTLSNYPRLNQLSFNQKAFMQSSSAISSKAKVYDAMVIKRVFKEYGLSGYHAIKNGCYFFQLLKGDELEIDIAEATERIDQNLNDLIKDKIGLSLHPEVDLNEKHKHKNLYNKTKIEQQLDAKLTSGIISQVMIDWGKVEQKDYSILSSFDGSEEQLSGDLLDIIDQLQQDIKKLHLFILGEQLEKNSNWFSVIVKKNTEEKKFEYHIMNSDSRCKFKPLVNKLKQLVETPNLALLKNKQLMNNIENEIVNAEVEFKTCKLQECMQHLSNFADLIISSKLQYNQVVCDRYLKRVKDIVHHNTSLKYAMENKKEAEDLREKLLICFGNDILNDPKYRHQTSSNNYRYRSPYYHSAGHRYYAEDEYKEGERQSQDDYSGIHDLASLLELMFQE